MAHPAGAPSGKAPFLDGCGATAAAIAAFDWASTPLGPIESWPASLRSVVAMLVRSPVAMALLWGPEGHMLYNDAYALIAGQRHPAALGSTARESWPEVADFNAHVLRTVLGDSTLTYEDQPMTLARNGQPERTWFTLHYSAVLDDAQRPGGVMAVVIETTLKMQTEQWLRGERDRLRQMFEQSPGFMAMLRGPTHVFDLVNPGYLQLVGHRDVLGKTVREALPDIEGQGFYELLDQVFASGEAFTGKALAVKLQRRPGGVVEERFVDLVYQPVCDAAGQVQGIFAQGTDVTDQVLSERQVQASESRHRQILDSAIDYAIIAFDLQGRVTRWNRGAELTLGWTEQEMLGQDGSHFFTPEDRAGGRMQVEMRASLARGVGNDERWHVRKSGERFWANGEMTPLRDDAGQVVGFVKVLRDRTQEHRAAEALRRSEQRLQRAQQAGGVGTFTVDLDSQVLHGTAEFNRIFGLEDRESMPAAEVEALLLPEDERERLSPLRPAGPQSAPLDVEYRIQRANDGALRWIARKAEYETDENGRPVRLVGVVQDVTERKAAQRALEESAAQFMTFAQSLPSQVWTAPASGLLDWFNDRVYEYSGAQPGELDGNRWLAIVHPEDHAHAGSLWADALASGERYETEFRVWRADGEYRWHLVRALPIRSADGGIHRWVGTNTDIHERKLAETETLRDRDRIWRSARDLMAMLSADGRLRSVNPAWQRLLGNNEADLLGRPLAELVPAAEQALLAQALSRAAAGKRVRDFELRLLRGEGASPVIAWTAERVDNMLFLIGRDVTDQRATEDALRQSQKMEAVGQLTGGIAHDFNNLLQGITGSLELVKRRLAQGQVAELDRFVSSAVNSAKRAAALTHRLLAFSRRQPLDPRTLQVNALVGSMEDLLRRTLGERIALRTALADDLWLTRCDPNQLESAVLNLVINARDAMPDGGQLTLETHNAVVDPAAAARQPELKAGRYACLSVTDTGTGMSPDTLARAFEPFFTTKPMGQGTGLGLSMIYGFARQSEGFAKIYSELGRGTSVKLYLPQDVGAAQDEEPLPALSEAHLARRHEQVLVVEDEAVVRALIVELLGELGYRALEAADGPAGLALLQSSHSIDLLITDVGLPGLNGRQIADAARTLRPALKVLFMTGYAENAAMASGFLEPGMALITKPFAMEALATKIRESLGQG